MAAQSVVKFGFINATLHQIEKAIEEAALE